MPWGGRKGSDLGEVSVVVTIRRSREVDLWSIDGRELEIEESLDPPSVDCLAPRVLALSPAASADVLRLMRQSF